MRHRLPSLNALRAFEATARRGSVSIAADELQVTPGAVSRQVTLLEAHFDCRLFIRRRRGLELTQKGRRYFGEITAAFERIDAASAALQGSGTASPLRVRVYTTLATEWLLPRLADFRSRNAWIDFRLDASLQDVNFDSDEIDVGVLRAPQDWTNLEKDLLYTPLYFPVCSPSLLEGNFPLRSPEDLRQHTLLHSSMQLPNWRAWFAAAGVSNFELGRGLAFENSSLTYRAAREGAGIALGQRLFLTDDLISGRLVVPFDLTLRATRGYFLACLSRRAHEAQIVAFRNWFVGEVADSEARATALLPEILKNVVEQLPTRSEWD